MIPAVEMTRHRLRGPIGSDLPAMTAFGLSDRTEYVGGPIAADQTRESFASAMATWGTRGWVLVLEGFERQRAASRVGRDGRCHRQKRVHSGRLRMMARAFVPTSLGPTPHASTQQRGAVARTQRVGDENTRRPAIGIAETGHPTLQTVREAWQ